MKNSTANSLILTPACGIFHLTPFMSIGTLIFGCGRIDVVNVPFSIFIKKPILSLLQIIKNV
jgi:hypothetical protein